MYMPFSICTHCQCCQGSVRCANLQKFPNPEPEPQAQCKIFRTLNLHRRFRFTGSGSGFTRFEPGSQVKIFQSEKYWQKRQQAPNLVPFFSLAEEWMTTLTIGCSFTQNTAGYIQFYNSTSYRAATGVLTCNW